jgi:hypothetical protein
MVTREKGEATAQATIKFLGVYLRLWVGLAAQGPWAVWLRRKGAAGPSPFHIGKARLQSIRTS